jgi:hypothetical protein
MQMSDVWPTDGPLQDAFRHAIDAGAIPRSGKLRDIFDFGVIIGVVDLVDVHEGHNTETDQFRAVRSCFRPGKPYGPCSRWAEADAWHLVLANPRPLTAPIPFKGALHLQTAPAEVEAQIVAQVGPLGAERATA